jgi:hypothetical protein
MKSDNLRPVSNPGYLMIDAGASLLSPELLAALSQTAEWSVELSAASPARPSGHVGLFVPDAHAVIILAALDAAIAASNERMRPTKPEAHLPMPGSRGMRSALLGAASERGGW